MTTHPLVHSLRMQTFGIPQRFRSLTLDSLVPNPAQEKAYAAATEFVANLRDHYVTNRRPLDEYPEDITRIGRGLIFSGPPGTGKTTLAAATIVSIYYRDLLPVRFLSMPDYVASHLERMRLEGREDEDSKAQLFAIDDTIQDANDVPVLLLDEVGNERKAKGSAYGAGLFDQLIRSRYNAARPTIITTNMPVKDWKKFYNPSVGSFAFEAFEVYTIKGEDNRAEG